MTNDEIVSFVRTGDGYEIFLDGQWRDASLCLMIERFAACGDIFNGGPSLYIRPKKNQEPWESLKFGMICMASNDNVTWRKQFYQDRGPHGFNTEGSGPWTYCRPCTGEELAGMGVRRIEG